MTYPLQRLRARLAAGPANILDVARLLGLTRREATVHLVRWAHKGKIRRVRRGVYGL